MLARNASLSLLSIGIVLTSMQLAPQQTSEAAPIDARAQEALAKFVEASSGEALSVTVAIGGEVIFHDTRGTLASRADQPLTAQSPFPAASMAHAFLVTAVLQLEADDKLNHEDRVIAYLPELLPEDCPLRIDELMAHTSGLPDFRDFTERQALTSGRPTYRELLAVIPDLSPPPGAGDCVRINPTDTALLAALLERVSGTSIPELLETRLFRKLGMTSTGYRLRAGATEAAASTSPKDSPAFLARGLFSTAADLLRFQRGLIDLTLLGSDQLTHMNTMVRLTNGTHSDCGLGVRQIQLDEAQGLILGEPSDFGAAQVTYYPVFDLSVVVLAQDANAPSAALARDLARLVIEPPARGTLDLPLTPEGLQPYIGSYQIGCSTILVRSKGARILVDEVDRKPLLFLYQGDHEFVAQENADVRLTFQLEGDEAVSFILDRHGLRSRAVRFRNDG